MQQNEFKILVVDDEGKIVEVVESYLEASGYKVYTAFDCKAVDGKSQSTPAQERPRGYNFN